MPPVTKEEKAAKNRRYYEKNKEKIRKRQADHYLKRKSKKAAASTGTEEATPQEARAVESRRGVCRALLPPAMKSSVEFVVFLLTTNHEQSKNKRLSKKVQVDMEWRKRAIGEAWCCPPGSRPVRTLLNQFPATGGRRWTILRSAALTQTHSTCVATDATVTTKTLAATTAAPNPFPCTTTSRGKTRRCSTSWQKRKKTVHLSSMSNSWPRIASFLGTSATTTSLFFIKMCYLRVTYVSDLDFSVVVACSDRAFRKDEPVPKIFATRLEAPSLDPAS